MATLLAWRLMLSRLLLLWRHRFAGAVRRRRGEARRSPQHPTDARIVKMSISRRHKGGMQTRLSASCSLVIRPKALEPRHHPVTWLNDSGSKAWMTMPIHSRNHATGVTEHAFRQKMLVDAIDYGNTIIHIARLKRMNDLQHYYQNSKTSTPETPSPFCSLSFG